MKIASYTLMLSSLISLILVTFAYRDFSIILAMLFTHIFLGLPLATFFLVKRVNWQSKTKLEQEEIHQDCDLVNKFNINSK
tara:strand:+ start:206 stop:448 length:243 start_codon:yes stop_codon:yes gene_type:complete